MPLDNAWTKQLKQNDVIRWAGFCVIALAVIIFYFPSLFFPPRADQVIYLSETSNSKQPLDLIFGCYDHNRHRTIAPGDELLFRPLLYAFLGSEQVIFGHHFGAWQLVGLLAHLILIWVLLRLLWHLSNPWLAFAGAWVFALSVFNYELVTWTHLSSYLLMIACMVGAVEQVVFCFEDQQIPWGRIIRMLVYFFIACFIYETANIFVLMITGMLIISFPRMKGRLSILLAPVVLYVFFSFYNYVFISHVPPHLAGIKNGIAIGKYARAVIHLTLWWLYEGLFNGVYHYIQAIRTMFVKDEVMVFKPLVLDNPQVVLGLMMISSFLGLAWMNRFEFYKRIKLEVLLWGMLFAYVTVIVIGRFKEGDLVNTVGINSYYSYIFWVIMTMIAFLSLAQQETKSRLQRWLVIIFVLASLLSGLWQGKRINDMAVRYGNETNSIVLLVTTLDLLIQEKQFEPNFSFYVDPDYPGNYPYGSIRKINDPPSKKYSFAEFLYPRYFHPRELAKYKFLAQKK